MPRQSDPTIRDAELRLDFALAYLKEVRDEQRRAARPSDWDEIVTAAQQCVDIARATLTRLHKQIGGENGDCARTAAAG